MEIMNLYEIMCIWTMVGMSMVFKPRVLIGFHHNHRFLESRVGKTLNAQEKHGILHLRLDSWFNCKVMEFGLE